VFDNADGANNSNSVGQSPPEDPPGAYIDLPNGMISDLGDNATFEVWAYWDGTTGSSWQRIFDFGTSISGEDWSDGGASTSYLFLTPRSGPNTLRFGYRDGPTAIEHVLDDAVPALGEERHIVAVWDGENSTASLYVNGQLIARDTDLHVVLSLITDDNNWLGRSQWPDAMFDGGLNELRIYDRALTWGEIAGNAAAGPDTLTSGGGGLQFRRGDPDDSGGGNITDAIAVLNHLFAGSVRPVCWAAADANGDGSVNVSDPVYHLNFLFGGGTPLPPPGNDDPSTCGPGTESDEALGCDTYTSC
jgi:hypothetical protein